MHLKSVCTLCLLPSLESFQPLFSQLLLWSELFQAPFTMPVTPELDLLVSQRSLRLCLWFFPPCCSGLMICISLSASSLTFFCHLRFAYWAHPVDYFSCFIFLISWFHFWFLLCTRSLSCTLLFFALFWFLMCVHVCVFVCSFVLFLFVWFCFYHLSVFHFLLFSGFWGFVF